MADETNAVGNIITDAALWYNVGLYGDLGYAVPNPSNDIGTLNPNIADFTNLVGRSLFLIMHHEDVDMSTPPSINTLMRVHQLYKRAGQILTARAIPRSEMNMETAHVTPGGDTFRVYPIPFFKVRNQFMKRWANWVLIALAEAFQDTENRKTIEISTDFAARIGQYFTRLYQNMAMEVFGKTRDEAIKPGFLLTDADFKGWNPASFFTPQELIDPVPALDNVFTEDRKAFLAVGVPLTELPLLGPYPLNLQNTYAKMRIAREKEINPDTGLPASDGQTISQRPIFPQGQAFVA